MAAFGDDFGFGGHDQGFPNGAPSQGFGGGDQGFPQGGQSQGFPQGDHGGFGGQDFGGGAAGQDGSFGEVDPRRRAKEEKRHRRKQQAEAEYGHEDSMPSNFTSDALGQAHSAPHSGASMGPSGGDYNTRPSHSGASMSPSGDDYNTRRGERGFGDDFRNRDEGFNEPVERRNFGFSDRPSVSSERRGMEPARRGFSFNLNDMPAMSHGQQAGTRPQAARWNPFEGMRRNWDETRQEAQIVHTAPVHVQAPGFQDVAYHPAMASSAGPPGYPGAGAAPSTLESELFRTEERVHAIRTKLSRLEADMVHGSQSPVTGYLRVVVTHLVAGGHLGLSMRGTLVSEVVDPQAREFGWFAGDRVLKVNGYQVDSEPDFSREVAKAMDAYRMTSRPLVFDVFREPHQGLMGPGTPPMGMGMPGSFGPPSPRGMGTPPMGHGMGPPGSFVGGNGGYGAPFHGPPLDPQLQRLSEENFMLRQSMEREMIGQSMVLNGPPAGKGSFGSFPPMSGKGGPPMGPFDTRSGTPPPSMRSHHTMPPTGMMTHTMDVLPPPMGGMGGPPTMLFPPTMGSGVMPPPNMGPGFHTMDPMQPVHPVHPGASRRSRGVC